MSDDGQLASLNRKLGQVRDQVRLVALKRLPGCYVWGSGGVGKTHAVKEVLAETGVPSVLTNTWVTGRGLFDLLQANPDAVHILDDVEAVLTEPKALALLRAALDSHPVRTITYRTAHEQLTDTFTGGVVIVGNQPVGKSGPLAALATRVNPVEFRPTPGELTAYLRVLAAKGYSEGSLSLSPDKCQEVADRVVQLAAERGRPLNLRAYISGCKFRVADEAGLVSTSWPDLLDSALAQTVLDPANPTREVDKRAVARAIAHLPRGERTAEWKKRTDSSEPAMYRWLRKVREEDYDAEAN